MTKPRAILTIDTNNIYKTIGANIKKCRQRYCVSQTKLAQKIGYQTATPIALFEKGIRKIQIDALLKICNYFHTPIEFFISNKKTPKCIERITSQYEKSLFEEMLDNTFADGYETCLKENNNE